MAIKIKLEDFLNKILEKVKTPEKGDDDDVENKAATAEEKTETADRELLKSDVGAELDEIEREYQNNPIRTYGGKKVANLVEHKYDPMTDEEIGDLAKAYADEIYTKAAATAKTNAEESKKRYKSNAENVKARMEEAIEALDKSAEKAKQDAEDQALKRGIARSSIAAINVAGVDNAAMEAKGEVYRSAEKEMADIDEKISALDAKLDDDLARLDAEAAAETNKKIKELKDERAAKLKAVTEYNNTLRTKKVNELKKLDEVGVSTAEEDSAEYIDKTNKKIDVLYEFYRSLGNGAKAAIKNDKEFIVSHIGNGGYNYLNSLLD